MPYLKVTLEGKASPDFKVVMMGNGVWGEVIESKMEFGQKSFGGDAGQAAVIIPRSRKVETTLWAKLINGRSPPMQVAF